MSNTTRESIMSIKAKLISIAVAVMLCGTAAAEDPCTGPEELAEMIMTKRQQGAPMSAIMRIARSQDAERVRSIAVKLTMAAYDEPRYTSEEYQRRAVREFRNEVYRGCVKATAK